MQNGPVWCVRTVKCEASTGLRCWPCAPQERVSQKRRISPARGAAVGVPPQVGLAILLRAGTVFRCYSHIHLTMFHSELGASKAILDAGFGLDCLMLRHRLLSPPPPVAHVHRPGHRCRPPVLQGLHG